MDSLTQLVLGASVSMAVMGRRTAVWKSALWGGVAGTLPDLDALIDHGDAVLNMVLHRAETHALFYHLLASVPLAWLVARVHDETPLWRRWWLAMWLVLTTHALLDAFTVYGTQLLLPFTDKPYGIGSLFIIDPAYTLPLLVGTACALAWPTAGLRANHWALVISSTYLGWSVAAQGWVTEHARSSLAQAGLPHDHVLVTPAPFTTALWRVVSMGDDHYHEGYYALLDRGRTITFRSHDRGAEGLKRHAQHPHVQRIAQFSQGFYRLREQDGQLWITDLRMGQEPAYVFDFQLDPHWTAQKGPNPAVRVSHRADLQVGLPWIQARLLGQDLPPLSDLLLSPP
jgi:inner membrane protein